MRLSEDDGIQGCLILKKKWNVYLKCTGSCSNKAICEKFKLGLKAKKIYSGPEGYL